MELLQVVEYVCNSSPERGNRRGRADKKRAKISSNLMKVLNLYRDQEVRESKAKENTKTHNNQFC